MEAPQNRIACGNAIGIMAITWDGKVVNCVMDVDNKYELGDVNKDSIRDIWDKHNKVLAFKHMEHKWEELPEICRECKDWAIIGEERFDDKGKIVNKNYSHTQEMLK